MDSDPQVLKGLGLLLEDMQFKVSSARHQDELENIKSTQTDCPALLLLSFEFAKDKTGHELVMELRAHFKQSIPAILLSHENGMSRTRFIEEDIIVLSDRIKPKDLRRHISTILTNTLAV